MGAVERALGMFFHPRTNSAGQNSPDASQSGAMPLPAPGAGQQVASDTLASLLGVQQQVQPPTAADIANNLIGQVDTDGDGQLSAGEMTAALNQGGNNVSSDAVSAAVAKVDTNGDGKLSADELTAAVQQQLTQLQEHHHHRHHGGGAGVSSADLGAKIIGAGDANGDGALSQDELANELGKAGVSMSSSDLTAAFKKLDSNGDGALSGAELAAAIDAFRGGASGNATGSAGGATTVTA
jgi:Ca2+-binding EF-hand superfamily protein